MELYRISKRPYRQDLSGYGAYLHGGRWNTPGYSVLYTAGSRSLAMLEALVHLPVGRPPQDFDLTVLYVPDGVFVETLDVQTRSKSWRESQSITQQIGDEWLRANTSLILRIPSAIVKAEFNYLLNPHHAAFDQVRILDFEPFTFDVRLLRL
jgi:RES domain-containing protein